MKRCLLSLITCVSVSTLSAISIGQTCRIPAYANLQNFVPVYRPIDLRPEELWLDADAVDGDEEWLVGRGNAFLEYKNNQLRGELLRFNRQTLEAYAEQGLTVQNGVIIKSDRIYRGGRDSTSTLTSASYFIQESRAHGHAKKVTSSPQNDHLTAHLATFTTCDELSPTWYFKAKRVDYYPEKAFAVAKHIQVRVKDVPVFYWPYYRFNMANHGNVRQTGFLKYDASYRSKQGLIYIQPFYLNIAPNFDATLSAGYLSKLGPVLNTEWRYLTEHSHGIFETRHLFYKDHDFDSGSMRRWMHESQLEKPFDGTLDQVNFTIDYNAATDKQVLGDMFDGFYSSSTNHLRQQAHLNAIKHIGDKSRIEMGIIQRRYDILDKPIDSPYFYKPQIYATTSGELPISLLGAPIKWRTNSSYTDLEHPTKAEGQRISNNIELSHRIQRPYGFFNTTLKYRQRNYDFPDGSSTNYALPTIELDGALRLEKTYQNGLRHEMVPRLYYAYTPYRQQSSIPTFESTARSENYNTLFNTDRFTDQDRIGDVNKVTIGLENRFYDDDNQLRLEARMAQSLFLDSPQLRLDGSLNTEERKRSQAYIDVNARVTDHINVDASAVFDDNDYSLNRIDGGISYQHAPLAVRLGYLNDRVDNDQYVNVSGVIPINNKVRMMGRLQYDINNHGITEQLVGVEYGDCCTIARLGYRGYRESITDNFKQRAVVEIELKGVGAGKSGGEFTERIFGFKRR